MQRHIGGDEFTDLTERQEQALDFIESRAEQGLPPPTRAELAKHMNYRSVNAAEEVLKALQRKGRIELMPNITRGIKIVRP